MSTFLGFSFLICFIGGMLSVFLMGCYDEKRDKWLTVTKVNKMCDVNSSFKYQFELKWEIMSVVVGTHRTRRCHPGGTAGSARYGEDRQGRGEATELVTCQKIYGTGFCGKGS